MKFYVPSDDGTGLVKVLNLSEDYVVRVLGISPRILLEGAGSYRLNRIVLREHLLFEGWWSDAKQKVAAWVADNPVTNAIEAARELGDKGKAVVTALTSIVSTGGDAMGTVVKGAANLLSKGLAAVTKAVGGVSKRVKEIAAGLSTQALKDFVEGLGTKIGNISQFITNKVREATSGGGWKGMLATIVAFLGVSAVRSKIDGICRTALDALNGDGKKMLAGAASIAKVAGKAAASDDDEEKETPPTTEGEEGSTASAVAEVVDSIKGFAWGVVKDALGQAGAAAVEQLAGPIGWIKKLAEIFAKVAGGAAWVLENILSAIERVKWKPLTTA